MNEPQKNQERQVTLEDLLRLKRAERPSPDFWVQFDAELKRKQLASAIVQRRPWWQFSPRTLRLAVPVGAAAAVAFSFVAIRPQFSSPAAAPVSSETPEPSLAAQVAGVSSPEMIAAPTGLRKSSTLDSEISGDAMVAQASAMETPAASTTAVETPRFASYSESLRIAPPVNGQDRYPTLNLPSVSLAAITQSVSLQSSALSESSSSQGDVWQDSRRARLQAYAEPVLSSSNRDSSRVNRSRERVASRLNEQALSDSISRLGMADGRLLIRF